MYIAPQLAFCQGRFFCSTSVLQISTMPVSFASWDIVGVASRLKSLNLHECVAEVEEQEVLGADLPDLNHTVVKKF